MIQTHEDPRRALKRMLSNGALTGLPKRLSDQELLTRLAAARFEAGRDYREAEVNDALSRWLGTFCEPYGIDHVTLRRMLVDARYLVRDKQGACYRLGAKVQGVDAEPAAILAEIAQDRQSRKEKHAL